MSVKQDPILFFENKVKLHIKNTLLENYKITEVSNMTELPIMTFTYWLEITSSKEILELSR